MIKSCYSKEKCDFDITWPGRVARHDLVYLSPPSDPMQYGIPIGNGDIGALVWCEERKIIIAFNKCDLWDDAPEGDFYSWDTADEERRTTLRHACRIVVDFGLPVFDTFYLKDFRAQLHLQNGCIEMSLEGPFGTLAVEIFITYEGSMLCARVKTDLSEDDGMEITLERYGSRTYSFWYHRAKRDPSIGLGGTDSWIDGENIFLLHKLTTGNFICALRPEGDGMEGVRRTSHMVSACAEKCPKEFKFYALVTSPLEERNDEDYARSALAEASVKGFDALLAESETCWRNFWEKSFIETDDDYLDNLWHLAMYYSCAGQRGRYPGRFINSLWNWNRDVQPWNFYFHWNQQEVYWGLNAAGHHELCESYLEYRLRGMEHARKTADNLFGVKDGLFVSDVCDRRGYNSVIEKNNHTPVGEIALDFWRQYLYTGDREFLEKKALPYMLGAARFFATLLIKEEDGRYHAKCGSTYEGSQLFYDPITELAMVNVLFRSVLEALKIAEVTDPDEELFFDLLENIAPIQTLDADRRMLCKNGEGNFTIQLGMFKGKTIQSSKVFAVGRVMENNNDAPENVWAGQYVPQFSPADAKEDKKQDLDGNDIVCAMLNEHAIPSHKEEEIEKKFSGHPQACVAPVFPMGMIGIKDKGSDMYNAAVATALVSRNGQLMGWDTMPIVLARLGLADEVDKYIYDYPSFWQYYNNGFGHYGPNGVMLADKVSPFRRDQVGDAENMDEKFQAETFPFRHMGLEPLGVFSAVMNERLLQSHDGVIRIAPAYGKRNARFKLHAIGGFEIMSEICQGTAVFVAIRSLRGENLKMESPWESVWCEGKKYTSIIVEMNTEPGKTYLFTPDGEEEFDYEEETPAPNKNCKVRTDRRAMLGLERSF